MLRIMIRNWWLFACRAAFALMFATYIWFIEGSKLPLLLRAFAHASTVVLFGLFAFGAGIFTLVAALRRASRDHGRGLLLLDGLGACAIGVLAVAIPSLLVPQLVWIIVAWSLFIGVCEILIAQKIRHHLRDEYFLAAAGCGSLIFGCILLPGWITDEHFLLIWLSAYSFFNAITMAGFSYRLWKASNVPHLIAQAPLKERAAATTSQ